MATGHGEKLTRKQEQCIAALLVETSVKRAAAKAGVGPRTLYRWLAHDAAFRSNYLRARRALVDNVVARLQRISAEAARTLRRNLRSRLAADQIRAATKVIEFALRGVELADLAERVEALEAASGGQQP